MRPRHPSLSLLLSLSILAISISATGCGESQHSVLYSQAVRAMEDYASALEPLNKGGSSSQAAVQIQDVAHRMEAATQKLQVLPKLTEQKANQIRRQYGSRILRAQARLEAAGSDSETTASSDTSANHNVSPQDAAQLLTAMIYYTNASIQLDEALGFADADALQTARSDLQSMQATQTAMNSAVSSSTSAPTDPFTDSSSSSSASNPPTPTFDVASNASPSPTFNTTPGGSGSPDNSFGQGFGGSSLDASTTPNYGTTPNLGGNLNSGATPNYGATPNLGGNLNSGATPNPNYDSSYGSSPNLPSYNPPTLRPQPGLRPAPSSQLLKPQYVIVHRPGRPPMIIMVIPDPVPSRPTTSRPPASNYASSGLMPSTNPYGNSSPPLTSSGLSNGAGFSGGLLPPDSFTSPAHEATIKEVLIAREDIVRALEIVSSKNSALSSKETMVKSIEKLKAIAKRVEKLKPISKSDWVRLNLKYSTQASRLELQYDDAVKQMERNFPALINIFKKPIADLQLANEAVRKAVSSVTRDNVASAPSTAAPPNTTVSHPATEKTKPKSTRPASGGSSSDEEFSGFSSGS